MSRSLSWGVGCWVRCGSSSSAVCSCRSSTSPGGRALTDRPLIVALSVALALALAWPLALHARDPALFALWWNDATLGNYVAFFGNSDEFAPGYYLQEPALVRVAVVASDPVDVCGLRGRGFNGGLAGIPACRCLAVVSLVIVSRALS